MYGTNLQNEPNPSEPHLGILIQKSRSYFPYTLYKYTPLKIEGHYLRNGQNDPEEFKDVVDFRADNKLVLSFIYKEKIRI